MITIVANPRDMLVLAVGKAYATGLLLRPARSTNSFLQRVIHIPLPSLKNQEDPLWVSQHHHELSVITRSSWILGVSEYLFGGVGTVTHVNLANAYPFQY